MIYYYGNLCVLCSLFLLVLIKDSVTQQLSHPATDFSRHRLVQPTVHHGRTKREISSTRGTNGEHHSEVMISMEVDGEEYVLDLLLNQDLVTNNHVISYQQAGNTVLHKPEKEELDICQYSGTVRGKPGSRVAVSTCHGIRGVIFDDKRTIFIEPAEGSNIKSLHYIYDNSDYITNYRCGNDATTKDYTNHNSSIFKEYDTENVQHARANRYKRNAPRDTEVHGPYNANSKSRYVELALVVDKRGYDAVAPSTIDDEQRMRKIYAQMKDIANILNSVYSQLNIFIALVGVEVWNDYDKIDLEYDSTRTLDNFLKYRETEMNITNDNAHLITHQKFHKNVVGKAYTRVMCTKQLSAGIANFHTDVLAKLAMTIAHEMGHNFGMNHDDSHCKCPDDKCIMYPSTCEPRQFSSCSLVSLALTFDMGFDLCLRNKPERLFGSATCGNGFVEAGEQCDCGLPDPSVRNACRACCHSDTCMLRHNATCSAGACCDLQSCRPMAAGSVCRAAERECDLPEYCTGHSEYCPDDVHKMDTTPCGKDTAYCVGGWCRTHDAQCRLLWGSAADTCPQEAYIRLNRQGNQYGNCGRIQHSPLDYYISCSPGDSLCGSLQCKRLDEELRYGKTADTIYRTNQYIFNDTATYCAVVQIDLGINEYDAGMVPNGAKCGEDRMCLNQKCQSVAAVRADVARRHRHSVCPSDCSGHGICNSKGNCHCSSGFAPPACGSRGVGGSLDSGPASDPTVLWKFMVAMYIIFLGVLPLGLLGLLGMHYWRHLATRRQHKPEQILYNGSLQRRLLRSASDFADNLQVLLYLLVKYAENHVKT